MVTGVDNFELCPQVAEAEEKTAGGLLLTDASKEKPSIGTVSIELSLMPLSVE